MLYSYEFRIEKTHQWAEVISEVSREEQSEGILMHELGCERQVRFIKKKQGGYFRSGEDVQDGW